MIKALPLFAACTGILAASLTACASQKDRQNDGTGDTEYRNPIIGKSIPDPTAIRVKDGTFYLYGTEDTRNIPVYKSEDMVNWTFVGTAFSDDTRPSWDGNHSLWAPEIRYIDGKYVLYYSWARWGVEWESNVGVAVSASPEGPFTDLGCLVDANAEDIMVQNSIDQFHFQDKGKHYLFWGSFHGIYVTELEKDGLSIKRKADGTPALKKQVCGSAFEAVNIYKKGKYYYLLASVGTCCEGAASTYKTVVGRSTNVLGPYVDRNGKGMMDNAYETVVQGNSKWAGTGHNSIILKDDASQEWIIYHGYLRDQADKGRVVLMDKLLWSEDGWPYVEGYAPSVLSEKPVRNK